MQHTTQIGSVNNNRIYTMKIGYSESVTSVNAIKSHHHTQNQTQNH